MLYLEKFTLPDEEAEYRIARARRLQNGGYLDNGYPCMLFPAKELSEVDFEPITVLCGGNGSGKTTLLNCIALRLGLGRFSAFNGGELLGDYAAACRIRTGYDDEGRPLDIPKNSRIITSDDVFEYMLAARTDNEELRADIDDAKGDYARLKYGKNLRLSGMEDYEDFRLQVLARKKALTRRQFLRKQMGDEIKLSSNGETALSFFSAQIDADALYCLDEPENSLSPQMQLSLKALLEERQRYCGCQFVIATHSPFLLALSGAKIYDLDATPVDIKPWHALDCVKTYRTFFDRNRKLFEEE